MNPCNIKKNWHSWYNGQTKRKMLLGSFHKRFKNTRSVSGTRHPAKVHNLLACCLCRPHPAHICQPVECRKREPCKSKAVDPLKRPSGLHASNWAFVCNITTEIQHTSASVYAHFISSDKCSSYKRPPPWILCHLTIYVLISERDAKIRCSELLRRTHTVGYRWREQVCCREKALSLL